MSKTPRTEVDSTMLLVARIRAGMVGLGGEITGPFLSDAEAAQEIQTLVKQAREEGRHAGRREAQQFAAREIRSQERQANIEAIRNNCGPCGGSGKSPHGEWECEYCGKPVAAIEARGKA